MKKNKKIIFIVLFIVAFFGSYFLIHHPAPEIITELNYTDTIPGTTTVYDFMNQLRNENIINFTEKNYTGMGKFIYSINGVYGNGTENWIYYVNGVEAQVGVSNYKIKQGDIISWKYEKSNY